MKVHTFDQNNLLFDDVHDFFLLLVGVFLLFSKLMEKPAEVQNSLEKMLCKVDINNFALEEKILQQTELFSYYFPF